MRALLLLLLVSTAWGASPTPSASTAPPPAPAKALTKAPTQAQGKRATIPPLLLEVEEHYERYKTFTAQFNQVSKTAATGTIKKASGTVQFKRPNKFRWEEKKPNPSTTVSNGIKAWHYTPPFDEGEPGQVIEQKASKIRTAFANALLSGSFSAARDTRIAAAGPKTFHLFPKKGTAGTVKRAIVEIDPGSKQIRKVTLEHSDGGKSDIELSDIELGAQLNDDVFNFKIPPNTDRATPQ